MQLYITCSYRQLRRDLWQHRPPTPIMIAASSCYQDGSIRTRTFPRHARPTFCDSGGFVFASRHGEYPFSHEDYIIWLMQMNPSFASILDYPCEEAIAPDADAVRERQIKTLANARLLMGEPYPWCWVPVIQGRSVDEYLVSVEDYRAADLVRPYMGIGSLCNRTSAQEIEEIVAAVTEALPGVRLHLFGVKLQLFKSRIALPIMVASADTGAWNGRFGRDIDTFNAAASRFGLTQARTEIDWALPRYEKKVALALAQTKQPRLLHARRMPTLPVALNTFYPNVLFYCPGCNTQAGLDWIDVDLDEETAGQVLFALDLGICPCCNAHGVISNYDGDAYAELRALAESFEDPDDNYPLADAA